MSKAALNIALTLIAAPLPAQPPASTAAPKTPTVWRTSAFSDTLATAAALRQRVLVYFWMNGSEHCSQLWGTTLTSPTAETELSVFVCHSADATTPAGAELVQRYGVKTLPTLLVVTADGAADDAILGFIPLADFATEMQRVRADSGTVSSLRRACAAQPGDLNLRLQLSQKLAFVGDQAAADAISASIRRDDPEGASAAGAELLLFEVRTQILTQAKDQNDVTTWNLEPLYARLQKTREPAVLFKGWDWLANVEGQRGDPARQRAAWRAAHPHVPAAQVEEWGISVLFQLWERREEVQGRDRTFARDLATAVLAGVDGRPAGGDDTGRQADALRAVACGMSMTGKRGKALEVLARARALTPNDPELAALEAQIRK